MRKTWLCLAILILAACSVSGEAAGYKSQAQQYLAEGHLAQAVLTYQQALKVQPDDPDLLSGLGMALTDQGRDRSAAEFLSRASILKPKDAVIKTALAKLIPRPQDGLSLTLAWISSSPDSEPEGAAAAAGRIVVAYADGRLMALDEASGKPAWDIETHATLTSAPAVDATQVWVGAVNGSVLVFDAASGQSLGSYPTGGVVYAAPALVVDSAYCPSSDGSLYALERTNLKLAWKAVIGSALHASPLVSGQIVYVGANDGRLYGFNASSGARIWPYGIPTQQAIESVPALANGRIFFGSGDGRIYALDAETGGEYWHYTTPDAVYAQPLVLDDQVIVASSGQVLASLQFSDGTPGWNLSFDHPITQAPIFFKGRLYLVTLGDPHLFAVEPGTGKLLGEVSTGDWVAQGPLVEGENLILVGKDGAVFLYR